MQTVVERELELRLVLSPDESVPVAARLTYVASDPYAVHITFHLGTDAPVNWTFSRELLVEGVFRPCGHGDVRIWPTKAHGRSVICIALTSPAGNALVEAPASPVASWLERTLRVVPPGTERDQLAIDHRLDELFAPSSPDEPRARDHPCKQKDRRPDTDL